jgi:hypothetical protein
MRGIFDRSNRRHHQTFADGVVDLWKMLPHYINITV